MLRVTRSGAKAKFPEGLHRRGRGRFPGIGADAAKLGVSRVHLWLVLTGRRTSHSLRSRYHALKGTR